MADGITSTTRNQAPAAILINSGLLVTLMGFVNKYSLTVWIIHLQLMSYKSSFSPTSKLALMVLCYKLKIQDKKFTWGYVTEVEIMAEHWPIISWLCLSRA